MVFSWRGREAANRGTVAGTEAKGTRAERGEGPRWALATGWGVPLGDPALTGR